MYVSELATEVSFRIQDDVTATLATAANVVRVANARYMSVCRRIIDESDDYFRTSASLSVTANTATVALPARCHRVLRLMDPNGREYLPFDRPLKTDTWRYDVGFSFKGTSIEIAPTPTASGTWTLWYHRLPCRLTYGTAETGGATSITLAATATGGRTSRENGYYNDSNLIITSGTGSVATRAVSDYVGSTRVATIATGTAPDTTSVYETEIVIPDDWMDGILDLTAADFCLLDRNPEGYALLKRKGDEEVLELLASLRRRQERVPETVLDQYWDT